MNYFWVITVYILVQNEYEKADIQKIESCIVFFDFRRPDRQSADIQGKAEKLREANQVLEKDKKTRNWPIYTINYNASSKISGIRKKAKISVLNVVIMGISKRNNIIYKILSGYIQNSKVNFICMKIFEYIVIRYYELKYY